MGDESKVVSEGEELPKAIVKRIVKQKLSHISSTNSDISLFKEALTAFSESARIFIHYLSATANDICKESKRQTISADDVFKALEEIEFSDFVGPLKASLEEFKRKKTGKKTASIMKESEKEAIVENGGEEVEEAAVDDDNMNVNGDDDNMTVVGDGDNINSDGDGDGDGDGDDLNGGHSDNVIGDGNDTPNDDQ